MNAHSSTDVLDYRATWPLAASKAAHSEQGLRAGVLASKTKRAHPDSEAFSEQKTPPVHKYSNRTP
eukprot:345375-Alexandrium_andersonii.AAC.1